MNKVDISELKKRFKKTKVTASRLAGCYVAGEEREIKTYINDSFLNLEEEEMFKYLEIMKKTLSGTLGKNMLELGFSNDEELNGNKYKSLTALRDSELKNEQMLEAFYRSVIDSYDYPGNYLILLVYDAYDVPKKTEDGQLLDESEEVYKYILCSICPVELTEPGLSYFEDRNVIANRVRDWLVETPMNGFVFPAFTDRSADVHNLLYYVKDTDEMHEEFIDAVLGCGTKEPFDKQKKTLYTIVDSVLNEVPEYETFAVVKNINSALAEMVEEKEDEEPVLIDCRGMKEVFRESGIKDEHLYAVEDAFNACVSDGSLDARGLIEKNMKLKTDTVTVQVKPENADIIEVKIIDGRKCLVIPMDVDIEVNGVMRRVQEALENAADTEKQ